MIYSKQNIIDALSSGRLVIDPTPESGMFDTSAVDLRLGNRFTTFTKPNDGAGVFVTHRRVRTGKTSLRSTAYREKLPLVITWN